MNQVVKSRMELAGSLQFSEPSAKDSAGLYHLNVPVVV
jgi:hypothetical protein